MQSFTAVWSEEVRAEGTSRVTWEIEQVGDSCRLTVTHDQLREGANGEIYGGWPMILSGLKTLLETGETLRRPARCATHKSRSRLLETRRRTRWGAAASWRRLDPRSCHGSVPNKVSHHASCSVLIARTTPDLRLVQLARRGCVRYR